MFRAIYVPPLVALSFLTLLPVGVANPTDAEISRSRGWYPLVGLLYGALLLGLALLWALPLALPLFLQALAALLVVALAVANRFLHLDGLMDFCDAMWGGHTVERRLEIMRDSRVGSFAVAGCISVLLVKFSALLSLLTMVSGLGALLLFPMVSRWTMTLLLTVFPYGRQQGIGSAFASSGAPLAGNRVCPAYRDRRRVVIVRAGGNRGFDCSFRQRHWHWAGGHRDGWAAG